MYRRVGSANLMVTLDDRNRIEAERDLAGAVFTSLDHRVGVCARRSAILVAVEVTSALARGVLWLQLEPQ